MLNNYLHRIRKNNSSVNNDMMTTNFITTININGIMEIPAFITQRPLNPQKKLSLSFN